MRRSKLHPGGALGLALAMALASPAFAQVANEGPATAGPDAKAEAEANPWAPKPPKPDPDPFTVAWHGQLRARGVAHSGRDMRKGDLIEKEYVTQRARLSALAKTAGELSFGLMVQDARVWGEETDTLGDKMADGLDIHEAWAELPLAHGLRLKLGRQEIIHDDHRLIGNVAWTQRARSFDGARLMGKAGAHSYDAFWSMVSERDVGDPDGSVPAGRGGDVQLAGLHGELIFGIFKVAPAYYLRLNDAAREKRHTVGLRLDVKRGALLAGGAFYAQLGKLGDDDISAMLGAGNLGYELPLPIKTTLTLFGELLSGDGKPTGVFDTLYATNHKFYGEMDLFLAIPAHTKNLGLLDVGAKLQLTPRKGWDVLLTGHLFRLAKGDAAGEKAAGMEIDAKLMVQPLPHVSVNALVAVFLPGEAMRTLKGIGADDKLAMEQFGYLTCAVGF